jgi:hypothetical protein
VCGLPVITGDLDQELVAAVRKNLSAFPRPCG